LAGYRLPSEQMLKREFQKLDKPVKLLLFLSSKEESNSFQVYEFFNSIALQDPKITLDVITQNTQSKLFTSYHVSEVPTLIIEGSGVRYVGVPSGPEAGMFIQTIVMSSTKTTSIGDFISKILTSVLNPVQIRTIVTSQCTICPLAVRIGNIFALESALKGNGKVQHEIIEALEHADYVSEYDLSAVPIIIINEVVAFNGIPDVNKYVEKIAEAGK